MRETIKLCFKKIDIVILIVMTILIGIGLYCVRQAFINTDELTLDILKQGAGIFLGYLLILIIILIDYHFICSLSPLLYIGINLVLVYTLLFGTEINYVKRWITILGFQIQPSELTKVVLIVVITYACNQLRNKMDKLYVLFILGALVGIPMVLIVLEPHLSSTLSIFFIFIVMTYCSGISYKVIGKALAIVVPIVAGLFISVAVFDADIPFIEKYQVERILSFLSDDESENLSGAYQQLQSIGAISSGGLQGKMLLDDGDTRNYSRIYAKESDFVFAIVGEEFGFIGSFMILILYAILVLRCLIVAGSATDYEGRLLCIGVASYLMFQIFVNIGVATNLIPNTGLPLPFISNGLTSLVSSMAAVGLVLNVQIRQRGRV